MLWLGWAGLACKWVWSDGVGSQWQGGVLQGSGHFARDHAQLMKVGRLVGADGAQTAVEVFDVWYC
jgi:hypothetical protein